MCPCLGLDPFLLHICDLFFIFSLIFIVSDNLIKTHALCFFVCVLEFFLLFLDESLVQKNKYFSKSKSSVSRCCFSLIFCQFQPGIAYKRVAYKKKHVAGWHLLERNIILDYFSSCCSGYDLTLIRRRYILN